MTEITYEDGIIVMTQYGVSTIRFRMCDLNYESRVDIARAVMEMVGPLTAGVVGYLKTQPVEDRQRAIEEALGISFPLGMGDKDE